MIIFSDTRGISPLYSTLVIVLAAVVVGGGLYFSLFSGSSEPQEAVNQPTRGEQNQESPPETENQSTTTEDENTTSSQDTQEEDILALLLQNEETSATQLEEVDGSDASASAYRLVQDETLYHGVIATLPDPTPGTVYEGWLVQPEPLQFFSTGVMAQQEEGVWTLEFSSAQTYPSYTRVVITEEETVDGTPERHILEGDF